MTCLCIINHLTALFGLGRLSALFCNHGSSSLAHEQRRRCLTYCIMKSGQLDTILGSCKSNATMISMLRLRSSPLRVIARDAYIHSNCVKLEG
jgi:hypothetical protein